MLPYRAVISSLARRWRLLAVLGLAVAATAVAAPQLWAWYHFRAAQSALAHFDAAVALSHTQACLKVWPEGPQTHLLAARAARLAGSFDQAEEHLRTCQRLQPSASPETVLEWALLRAARGELDGEVAQFLQGHAQKHPNDAPLVWEALAEGYLRRSRLRDAAFCLDLWLKTDPDNVQALTLHGDVGWQGKVPRRAAPDYRRVIELDPGRDEVRWKLARCLLDLGSYSEALPHLEYLRQRRPDDPDILVRIARCQSTLGNRPEARAMLDAILAEHPEHGLALRARGQLALAEDQPADAEKWLRTAVRVMPYDYYSRFGLSQALHRQSGKEVEAERQKKRAEVLKAHQTRLADITSRLLSEQPHNAALHSELGTLLLEQGETETGLGWLQSALRLDAHDRRALTALADYYQEQGDAEKAAAYRRQAKLAPSPLPSSGTP